MPVTNNPLTKFDPISVRPNKIMLDQLADLAAGGFGDNSEIIRRAVDRMWREEIPAIDAAKVKAENDRLKDHIDRLVTMNVATAPHTVQVWESFDDGNLFGVILIGDLPIAALGPMYQIDTVKLLNVPSAAETYAGWSIELADHLAKHSDRYSRVYKPQDEYTFGIGDPTHGEVISSEGSTPI